MSVMCPALMETRLGDRYQVLPHLLHGAESPDSTDGFSASALSALSTVSTQQSTD